ncbi:MAG: thioredoxin-disulfide reductase [Thermoplasmatota archaeon]
MEEKVIIVGSGPAGLTAAIYAARANLAPLVIGGVAAGGQLMITSDVENYPGFPEGIMGPELMALFRKQAERFGARILDEDVLEVDFKRHPLKVRVEKGWQSAKSVILATGASARWLGLPSEERLRGRGVSACATCDGFFFKEKDVAVVGGGDTAMEEALFLTKFAKSVTVIHRRDEFRASKIMQDRLLSNPKVSVRWNSEVREVLGTDNVVGLKVENLKEKTLDTLAVQGFFLAIGHQPNTDFLGGQVGIDGKGYVAVHAHTRTSVPGVFVAGDVFDHRYRQAVTAAGSGCQAAIDAERWLEELGETVVETPRNW